METFDEELYDCLSEESFKELLEVEYDHADLLVENQRRKKALELFLSRNTITYHHDTRVGNLKNNAHSHIYVFGYEDEGKRNMERILKSEKSDLSNFTFEFVKGTITRTEISPEFRRSIKDVKTKMSRMDVPTAFVIVMNCSIYTSDETNEKARDELLKVLGPEVLNRCVLVLTYGKDMLKKKSLERHYDEITNGKTWVSNLYNSFYPRIIVIDTNEKSSYGSCCQRKQLKWLILHTCAPFDKSIQTTCKVKFLFFTYGMISSNVFWLLLVGGLILWHQSRLP